MSRRLLVLCWHNIEPSWAFPGTAPGRRAFARQLSFLRRCATVVPLRSALDDLSAGRPLPRRAVALTFDDGYLDNVTVAAPMLEAAGMPATFFLVPGFLSGGARVWWEELAWSFAHATASAMTWDGVEHDLSTPVLRRRSAESVSQSVKALDRSRREDAIDEMRARLAPEGPPPGRQFMDWDEAGGLLRHGHDIQSHTCAHPILSRERPEVQADELRRSRRDLQDHFGRPVDVLAFPNGSPSDYSADTLRLTREAGYTYALTTSPLQAGPVDDPSEMPRLVVDPWVDPIRLAKRWGAAWLKASGRQRAL